MINHNYRYAVIGASNNTEKYGYKVFKDLKENGYKVIPINPNEENTILNQNVYPTIANYINKTNNKIDVAIFITPPTATERTLPEVLSSDVKNVRFQPGAESEKAIQFCKDNNINYIHNACIMIQRKQ